MYTKQHNIIIFFYLYIKFIINKKNIFGNVVRNFPGKYLLSIFYVLYIYIYFRYMSVFLLFLLYHLYCNN